MAIRKPAPQNRLRVIRAEKTITQRDTALRAKLSVSRYWEIENRYVTPSAGEREQIAKALRVSVGDAWPSSPSSEAMSA